MAAYIIAMETKIPTKYPHEYIAEQLYKPEIVGDEITGIAKRLSKAFRIKEKSSVLDLKKFPQKILLNQEDRPEIWGQHLLNKLCKHIDRSLLKHVSVSYNISASADILPNVGSQMVQLAGLTPVWLDHKMGYGCAAGILSIEDSIQHCLTRNEASATITFDQCQWIFGFPNVDHPNFKSTMITNLLFADGAVGTLIVPEAIAKTVKSPKLKIIDIVKAFIPGNIIKMRNGLFLMEDPKRVMPQLVAETIIIPLLKKNGLVVSDIDEWSIHQGGSEMLKQFMNKDILGLTKENIDRSMELFHRHGNLSAPSCLFVLDSFFNGENANLEIGKKGIVVGFGAGYYLGAFLYEWAA